jgi:hypothetical protein
MPKIRDRQFNRTVRPPVRLRTDRKHSWRNHFRGVVAEVVGYLEMLSQRDYKGEFFVWAQIDDIVEHCNRYGGKKYSKAAVKLALEFLRKLRVVSGIVERKRFNQAGELQTFSGRIVTPHYVLCGTIARGKYCCFVPNRNTPGHVWMGVKATKNVGSHGSAPVVWYAGTVTKKP